MRDRAALSAICFALLSMAATVAASAQSAPDYPARPVRWIVGFPAGGSSDIVARILSEWLQQRLGQPVLVENRPGAGSNTATEAGLNAPPDGYTLFSVTSANAINATMNRRSLSFDVLKQVVPVAGSARGPSVMVVNPSVPAKTAASSSPMPRPIRARSIWARPASPPPVTWRENCSRRWRPSTSCTFPIAAPPRR